MLGRLDEAQASYRQALALHSNYAEAYSNLAFLLSDEGLFDEAAEAAQQAIDINPQLADAYLNLAEIDMSRLRHADALQRLNARMSFAPQHAVSIAADNARAHNTLGRTLQALGRHEEAAASFDRAAALPGTVREESLVARATLLMEMGNKDEAVAAFDEALTQFPGSVRVMIARTDSKTYRSNDPGIAIMEAALVQAIKPGINDQMGLHFALGKAYLDTADSERAFFHLDKGNAIKRGTFSYDPGKTRVWMERIAAIFTPQLMDKFKDAGAASERPIFIVGMPRSGTTLVEQILASHPGIHGAGELSALRFAVDGSGSFPDDLARIGREYVSHIDKLAPGALRVVDKMPANFLYTGLIPLILSGARIIHCRRDAADTCLSCYSKNFAGEQWFAYRQEELGAFHRDYQALMESLRLVMPPDRFIEVDYESVVDDLETQARRLISFAGRHRSGGSPEHD